METMLGVYTRVLVVMGWACVISVNGENLAFVSSNDNKIYKATLPDTVGEPIAFTTLIDVTNTADAKQLAYDPVERRLYWTDDDANKISRCDMDGNNLKDFVTEEEFTKGITLDLVNRTVYYTVRSDKYGIYSVGMDLEGQASRLLTGIPDDNSNFEPQQIVYGPKSRKLYYTVEWCATHGVESTNVDGSDRKTLVIEDAEFLYYPRHIYLDEREQKLYYLDETYGFITRIDLTESNPTKKLIYTGGNYPQGLAVYKDDIYWCDYNDDVIYRTVKDGSGVASPPVQVSATFDGGALDACRDIHFYIKVPCVSNLLVTSDSSSQLSVTWDLPSVLCPADWFRVEYQPIHLTVVKCDYEVGSPTTLAWQTQNTATLMNLNPYTTYRVSVKPGLGEESSAIEEGVAVHTTQDTGEAAPSDSPPGVTYEITDTLVIFTWQEIPCGSRGGLIDHYEYQMLSNEVVLASGIDTIREIALTRPPCGTVTFQVAGVNSAGMSDYTTLSFEVVSTESFMPNTGLQITGITETTADISWEKPPCPPSEYTIKYILVKGQCSRDIDFNYGSIGIDQDPAVTLTSLEPGSKYKIIVCAVNREGDQRQLNDYFKTPESVPSASPQNLQIAYGTGGSAQVTWDAIPCESRGGSSFYYSYKVLVDGVERRSGQTSETYFTELGSCYASGLMEFTVAGVTEAGIGTSSSVPYDVNLAGVCPQSCGIHGICDVCTKMCRCFPGYTGENCESSICNSGCQNGGECSATGGCLCLAGFMGPQCQSAQLVSNGLPTFAVEGQFSVTSCDGVPAVFTGDLNIDGSTARDEMLSKIQPLLIQFLGSIAGVISIGNVRFSPGSIVVSFTVTADSGTPASQVDNGLDNLIRSAPASGLTIDPGSGVTFTDGPSALCPQDYCKNGGTCNVGVTGTGMTCTCAIGYEGLQCEAEKETNLSGGAIGGIMAGVFSVLIVAILIGLCFCIYVRRQMQPDNQLVQPNINTLDLATSPYTYPRIDASGINNPNTLQYY